MKFSIGYNQNFEGMIQLIEEYKDHINELYFPIPSVLLGTSRIGFFQPSDYPKKIVVLMKKCGDLGIKRCLLLNATCEGQFIGSEERMNMVIGYVSGLRKLGLEAVQVANPLYAILVKEKIPEIEVQSSVNCYCKTVEHAKYLEDLGFNVLTIDRDINRDLAQIARIKKQTHMKIKILLNEGCLECCPFRAVHFNQISHSWLQGGYFDQKAHREFALRACVPLLERNPERVFRIPFVRPEDLSHYKNLCDYFKLATRTTNTPEVEIILRAYAEENFDGNLAKVLETQGLWRVIKRLDNKKLDEFGFFKRLSTCGKVCEGCDYCKVLLENAVEPWPKKLAYEKRRFSTLEDAMAPNSQSVPRSLRKGLSFLKGLSSRLDQYIYYG